MLRALFTNTWAMWIGFRFLRSKKSSRFLSFITVISMLGVGIGVAAIVTVLSVMEGFEQEMKKRLMAGESHILITPTHELPSYDMGFVSAGALEGTRAMEILTGDKRVKEVHPIVSTETIVRSGRKVSGAVLKGVSPAHFKEITSRVTETAEPQLLHEREGGRTYRMPGVYVGKELAYQMGLIPGDRLTLISPTEMDGPLGTIPRFKRFVVEGIYQSGLPEQELHTLFTTDALVRSFLRRRSVVSQWEVVVHHFDDAPEVAALIRGLAPGFRIRDWIQLNANLFASLRLERIAMFVILAFIIIVASFNIVTTLSLMVLEKTKDISILKAMGARNSQVAALFLSEGLLIGVFGVFGGALTAYILCILLKRYEFIELPDIYYDRTLPVAFVPEYYILVALSALSIVLAACMVPSRRAERLHPLEGIRLG